MKLISIGSKQIAFVRYDDQASQMHIQYHTGHTHTCCDVLPEHYQRLLQSPNPYDLLMQMTSDKAWCPPQA
ncbi:KTSC domain-containing protein [Paenibacillus tyrfis]|uniref:KTSC domain-containing protein n=1 Tax=Paenibacillus tyrfis TaxID=1501230 RepID=A0A081NSX1_9BACL|nr:KTSC domain-containing protein [Paenibacillus tyrfis]KEQ21544.1 hypothetical protein ET33_03670 [Paenibacillus tyrfis]